MLRHGLVGALVLLLLALPRAASAQRAPDLPELKREYPGSGPFVCSVLPPAEEPDGDERARAAQLATDANQAMILGDLERVDVLLQQAVELDPISADLAYRHALVLEDLNRAEAAMAEYCRAIDLGVESLGVTNSRERIDALYDQIRARLPLAAQQAFAEGLIAADDTLWTDAIESFSSAIELAPNWADPLYNRALIREYTGQLRPALEDFRAYLMVVADPEDADAIAVSQRIGALEGAASVSTPSPVGSLALGIMPGMGHYYSRRPLPGTATLVAAGTAMAAGLAVREVTVLCLADVQAGGPCPPDQIVDEITERPYLWIGIGVGAAITVVGAIEAYVKAKRARDAAESLTLGPEDGFTIGLAGVSSSGGRLDVSFVELRFR